MTSPTPGEVAAQLRNLADVVAGFRPGPGPTPEPGDVPAVPTGLKVTLNAAKQPVLDWDAAADADEWDGTDKNNPAKPVQFTVTEPRSVRSVLKPGQSRAYSVRARNAHGESDWCTPVTIAYDEPAPVPGPKPGGKHPSDVLDLRNWTIMLPTGSQGDPDNEYVIGRSIPDTLFVDADGAVVFKTDVVDGVHSPNSKYPRTEAREMVDARWTKAAWSSQGPRWLEVDLAIDTSHLIARKRVNGIQIHDGGDDVCQVQAREDGTLGFAHNDGKSFEVIAPTYLLGERFRCRLTVVKNRIKVAYNGHEVLDIPKAGTGWYWKYGCYAQTGGASEFKEPPGSYAQVKVWSVTTGAS